MIQYGFTFSLNFVFWYDLFFLELCENFLMTKGLGKIKDVGSIKLWLTINYVVIVVKFHFLENIIGSRWF